MLTQEHEGRRRASVVGLYAGGEQKHRRDQAQADLDPAQRALS
jgi:hypothetical protein